MSKTDESFKNGSVHKGQAHSAVGGQGNGGARSGASASLVNNPRGVEPKSHGSKRMPLAQGPIEPKVGK